MPGCWSAAGASGPVAASLALGLLLRLEPAPLPFGETLPEDLSRALDTWPRCREPAGRRGPAGNVTVVSSVDGERMFLFALRESVRRASWQLRLPGHGQPWVSTAHSTRLVMDELRSLDACATVLVMDGFDTVIQRPETLPVILPANGKVLITSAYLAADEDPRVRRLGRLVYGVAEGGAVLNNGVLLGRAADVARVCEATGYMAMRFGVFAKQWGLNVMMSGAGPAFAALFRELVEIDRAMLLQTASFAKDNPAVVLHYPRRGNLLPALAELGIEPPPGWRPPLDYSSPEALEDFRRGVGRKFAAMHCHRSWLVCAQSQLLLRLVGP